jgi:hypothetical protein
MKAIGYTARHTATRYWKESTIACLPSAQEAALQSAWAHVKSQKGYATMRCRFKWNVVVRTVYADAQDFRQTDKKEVARLYTFVYHMGNLTMLDGSSPVPLTRC